MNKQRKALSAFPDTLGADVRTTEKTMNENSRLTFALELDGKGGGKDISMDGVRLWNPENGALWIHMDYTEDEDREWLITESGIDPVIVEALTEEETRPRSLVHKNGLLLILRGVNLNQGMNPEDMISIRLWIESSRIVTLRRRRVMAIDDLRQSLYDGSGPANTCEFLEELSDRLALRMGTVIADVDDSADALEDEIVAAQNYSLRQKISAIRRTAIGLRRYLAPQRDVMNRLYSEKVDWIDDTTRMRIREIADRTTRYVEDLDAIRDRVTVTQEELNNRLAEQMNKTMYVLSIVAGIFLPLGLITGLLGINVGGIPGTESRWAFTVVCILLMVIAGLLTWLFRKMKWM